VYNSLNDTVTLKNVSGANVVWGATSAYATNVVWGAGQLLANNVVWGATTATAAETTNVAINGEP
jgi:hypothetical protein